MVGHLLGHLHPRTSRRHTFLVCNTSCTQQTFAACPRLRTTSLRQLQDADGSGERGCLGRWNLAGTSAAACVGACRCSLTDPRAGRSGLQMDTSVPREVVGSTAAKLAGCAGSLGRNSPRLGTRRCRPAILCDSRVSDATFGAGSASCCPVVPVAISAVCRPEGAPASKSCLRGLAAPSAEARWFIAASAPGKSEPAQTPTHQVPPKGMALCGSPRRGVRRQRVFRSPPRDRRHHPHRGPCR